MNEFTVKNFKQAQEIAEALKRTDEKAAMAYMEGFNRRRLVERAAAGYTTEG